MNQIMKAAPAGRILRNPYTLVSCVYQRNGVSGIPFWAITFDCQNGGPKRRLIAIAYGNDDQDWGAVGPCIGKIAVLDVLHAATGDTQPNEFRGDYFEPQLRQWIAQTQVDQEGLTRHTETG